MEAINSQQRLTRSDCARPPSPDCDAAELNSLLWSFHSAATIPEASPWRGKHEGGVGLSKRWLKSNNRREEYLRIPASSRRISAIPGTVWFELGYKSHLLSEFFKFMVLEFIFGPCLEIRFLGVFCHRETAVSSGGWSSPESFWLY